MATPEGRTVDGFELQFGTNHLAHFLLTQLLMPTLLASTTPALPSRVISLSSSGHGMSPVLFDDYDLKKRGYDRWISYGQSKTANIYLATEIERRYGSKSARGGRASGRHRDRSDSPHGRSAHGS
jgi:NAD(P)-dependent dehydrogenase (short-subunit alcohol dehydrogenase family)